MLLLCICSGIKHYNFHIMFRKERSVHKCVLMRLHSLKKYLWSYIFFYFNLAVILDEVNVAGYAVQSLVDHRDGDITYPRQFSLYQIDLNSPTQNLKPRPSAIIYRYAFILITGTCGFYIINFLLSIYNLKKDMVRVHETLCIEI